MSSWMMRLQSLNLFGSGIESLMILLSGLIVCFTELSGQPTLVLDTEKIPTPSRRGRRVAEAVVSRTKITGKSAETLLVLTI